MSRRALLGTAAAVAVAGCQGGSGTAPPPSAPSTSTATDAAALATAQRAEARILAACDARIHRLPLHARAALQVERAIHATHLTALGGRPRPAPAPVRGSLAAALRTSAAQLRRLSLHAANGRNAALLASIAASHAASPQ